MKEFFTKSQTAELEQYLKNMPKKGAVIAYGGGYDRGEKGFAPILKKSLELCGKENPKMLFLPTAHRDNLEDREDVIEAYKNAGVQTDILLVSKASEAEIKDKIGSAHIIYETGGNLDFLTKTWSAKGVYPEIHKAFDRGAVLVGVSSGAMCWGERGYDDFGEKVLRITSSFPFIGKARAYDFCEASDILPFCICPHFDNIAWHLYARKAKSLDIPSICIDNSAVVIYQNGRFEVQAELPHRSAYLYYPSLGIRALNIRKHPSLMSLCLAHRLKAK